MNQPTFRDRLWAVLNSEIGAAAGDVGVTYDRLMAIIGNEPVREELLRYHFDFPFTYKELLESDHRHHMAEYLQKLATVRAIEVRRLRSIERCDDAKTLEAEVVWLLNIHSIVAHLYYDVEGKRELGLGELSTMTYKCRVVHAKHEPRPTFGGRASKRDIYKRK